MESLVTQLHDLGVRPGQVLLVHTAFSKMKPVAATPEALIEALRAALGPAGTLVMPSMSDDDDHPFDVASTTCLAMGVVADTFRRLPGVMRSDSPHAFAAAGPQAPAIVAPHPLDVPHGVDSPVGRVWQLEGSILLLGIDHTANTTIHLAENMTGVRYRQRKHVTVLRHGRMQRFAYDEIDHCCERFALVDGWLDEAGLQRRARLGGSVPARLVRSRDVVEVVITRLRADETLFLHPFGVDAECDAARASLD